MSENKCRWVFPNQPRGNEKGPNNPTALRFKGNKYDSLVRESIQNSMDAVCDSTRPVEVSFDYNAFQSYNYPNFYKLKEHIEGCLNKYLGDENGERLFRPMLNFFENNNNQISYLRVTDSNTKGMRYDPQDSRSPFKAYISEGVASKEDGSGGSFGFGKAVFWMFSPITTVFVSTKTEEGQVYFAGQSKLCTHFLEKGHDLAPNGLYLSDKYEEVITDSKDFPDGFVTREVGTSVYVLGVPSPTDEEINKMKEAILRNFWMAIYRNRLVVKLKGETISRDNLSALMEQFFDETNSNDIENFEYNPRVFYEIVLKAESKSDDYKKIQEKIDINGRQWLLNVYLHNLKEAKGQFVFMRKPLMTIYTKKVKGCKGAEGVFVCEDEEGNNFLREMEDCAHDSWTRVNYEARNNPNPKVASRTITAIYDYIKNCVVNELGNNAQEHENVVGLEKLLYISTPDDLGADNGDIVDPNNVEIIKKESPTSRLNKPKVKTVTKKKALFDNDGRLFSNSGRKKKKSEKKGVQKPGTMKNRSKEDPEGKEGIYAEPVDVAYRAWSQKDENDVIWHYIKMFSQKAIKNTIVEVYGVDEEGKARGLEIVEAPDCNIRIGEEFSDLTDFDDGDINSTAKTKMLKNAVSGIDILANIPKTIKLRFNSDIKYALRINTDKEIVKNEDK